MPPKNVPLKPSTSKTKPGAGTGSKVNPSRSKTNTKTGPAAGPSKGGPAPKKGSKPETDKQPKKKAWTPQDDAARKIQTKARQFLARKALERKKKEKQDYEDLMEKLEKEAFMHMVKMEQEEAERRQKKEDEERKRKQEENKRRKRMLEAAFDGDIGVMKQILREVSELDDNNGIGNDVIGRNLRAKHQMAMVDCEDPNGNTALSEAANGGHADAIRFLLERGAEPNSQGQFKRTPLYRAAFAGHLEATEVLLENGADPRIYASDSQTPAEIASTPAVQQVLQNWDISLTDTLQEKLQAAREKRAEEERLRKEAETSKLEDIVAEAQKEYETMQKQLDFAYRELNKRICEHDTAVTEGFDRPEITVQAINDQELEVESTKLKVQKARDNLAKVKLQLRESKAEADGVDAQEDLPGLKITVKELDDVLFRDVGNRIKNSGKWPVLIDTSGQAATFLRYRDTNYINALRPADMDSNNVRRSLLGALRFGKPFVIDMMEVDMFDTCTDRLEEVMPGLMGTILDRSIVKEEKFTKLIKKEDGPEYDKTKFNDLRLANFKFILITKSPYPNEKVLDQLYVIRVIIPV